VSAVNKYEQDIIMKILFNGDVRNDVIYISLNNCNIQTKNTVKLIRKLKAFHRN